MFCGKKSTLNSFKGKEQKKYSVKKWLNFRNNAHQEVKLKEALSLSDLIIT